MVSRSGSTGGRLGRGSQAASRSWLRPAPARTSRSRTLWRPPSLPANVDPKGLSYVVVEEQVGLILAVLVAPWPMVDRQGRLWFALDDVAELTTEAPDLQAALSKRRVPRGLSAEQADALRHRPVMLGDVFAARVDPRRAAAAASIESPPAGTW